jgi:hypothetical protein
MLGQEEQEGKAQLTLQRGVDLVLKFLAVDAAAAAAGAGRVTALDHEVGDDAVEDDSIVVAALGELLEVLDRLGRVLVVQLEDDGALRVGVSELCNQPGRATSRRHWNKNVRGWSREQRGTSFLLMG